jgi:hypothetical protein
MSTDEEKAIREEQELLKNLKVEELILQSVVTFINVSGMKLVEEKDAEQAKAGIEAARALLPLCPEEQVVPIQQALSQLQMLYVRETQPQEQSGEQAREAPQDKPPERPKPKIWTPGSP